jgi:4-hydroxythreonine-4-phosphate dehydrogenase
MSNIKVGITQGDINGISYEVILKTLEDNRICDLCTPIIYGSPKVAAYHRKMLNLNVNLNIINKAEEAQEKKPNIINCCKENEHP